MSTADCCRDTLVDSLFVTLATTGGKLYEHCGAITKVTVRGRTLWTNNVLVLF